MDDTEAAREVRRRYGVPDGIRLRVDLREVLAWVPGHEMSVREIAAHPEELPQSERLGGRVPMRRIEAPETGGGVAGRTGGGVAGETGGGVAGRTSAPLLVREYRKGGLLRHLRGARMRGRWRPLDELVLLRRLLASGVPVPEALGCVVLRGPTGWRGFLLVREVPDAVDLEALLHSRPGPAGVDVRREVLVRAGRAVRVLHDAGVPHPDLHPKNLLLAPDGAVLVLDLDKARPASSGVGDRRRLRDLVRLGRAMEKHRLKGLRAGEREALRFLQGYAGSTRAARLWFDRIRGRLGRTLGFRRIWWRLIGEARPWRPQAASRE